MKQEQAVEIVREINKIAGSAPLQSVIEKFAKTDMYRIDTLPEYYPTYKINAQLRQDARIHIEKGLFPASLYLTKAPNMTDEEFMYIKANHKQVTLDVAMDWINTTTRAWGDGNWHYRADKDEPEVLGIKFTPYIETKIKYHTSLENWGKSVLPTLKAIDANGVIAVKPFYKTKVVNVDGADKNVIDSDFIVEPQPVYYNCLQVVSRPGLEYFVFDVTEYDSSKKKFVYEVWDRETIWVITKEENSGGVEAKFNAELYFDFFGLGIERVPCYYIGGTPMLYKNDMHWQSPFSNVTDLLDLVDINSNTLQIVMYHCGFPTRVMAMPACQYPGDNQTHGGCADGFVTYFEGQEKKMCPSCRGTGLQPRISPTGVIAIKVKGTAEDGDGVKATEALAYVSPDPAILDFLQKKILSDEIKARGVLHIYNSNTKTQGSDNFTATDSNIDQKSMMASIKTISDQMFTLTENVGNDIGHIIFGEKHKPPTWTYPMSFDFKTEQTYIDEIDSVTKAGLPPVARQMVIQRYLKSHFFVDGAVAKFLQVIERADKLLGMTESNIIIALNKGNIEAWQYTLHNQAIGLLQELAMVDGFIDKDTEVMMAELIKKAQEATPQVAATTETKMKGILDRTSGQ